MKDRVTRCAYVDYNVIACRVGTRAANTGRLLGDERVDGWLWTAKESAISNSMASVDLVYVGGTAQLFQSMLGEIAFGIGGGPAIIHANVQRRTIIGVAAVSIVWS
jgi:hypothetical protein